MGHHLTKDGDFQSDKYPDLPPGRFVLSFADPIARPLIRKYALRTSDEELADDLLVACEKYDLEANDPA